jgi:hypothetical protein
MLWLSAQTPWGIFVVGKRPFTVGCGLQYNGEEDLTAESTLLVVPYGPFSFGGGFYPMRRGDTAAYNTDWDKTAHRNHPLGFVHYNAGNLSMGVGGEYIAIHLGPETAAADGVLTPQQVRQTYNTCDSVQHDGWAFMKYNNGRFFFNAELDWFNRRRTYQVNLRGNGRAPDYVESLRHMVEAGSVVGPGKLTFLYAHLPGHDRRNGVMIDRQPWIAALGNTGVFTPYSYLLGFNYGAGVDAFNLNGDGYINDACVLAGRLDYAVAANLNLYGTFMWADRVSKSWAWGSIRLDPVAADGSVEIDPAGFAAAGVAPSIPDNNLGWEVNVGADWQILEGLTFGMLGAYWQPGKWWNYACIDRSVAGWDNPNAGNNWGARPDRTIDPVMSFAFTVAGDF